MIFLNKLPWFKPFTVKRTFFLYSLLFCVASIRRNKSKEIKFDKSISHRTYVSGQSRDFEMKFTFLPIRPSFKHSLRALWDIPPHSVHAFFSSFIYKREVYLKPMVNLFHLKRTVRKARFSGNILLTMLGTHISRHADKFQVKTVCFVVAHFTNIYIKLITR